MSETFVHVRVTCPECKGEPSAMHPDWTAFWEWLASHSARGRYSSETEELAWWRAHGYPEASYKRVSKTLPDEKGYCSECDGSKFVERWDALEELLDPHLRRIWDAPDAAVGP